MRSLRGGIARRIVAVLAGASVLAAGTCPTAGADPWEQAHGMNLVDTSAGRYLVWSDQYGVGSTNGSWNHDVFALGVRGSRLAFGAAGKFALVSAHEAQEPASASVAGDGSVIVTFEDGNAPVKGGHDYSITQRYALFDARLHPTRPYSPLETTVAWGGHSGHAASTGDRHVVAYSEGWVDGGGVEGRGTGDDVWLASMKTDGSGLSRVRLAVGGRHRDGWPVVAASPSKALVVWERYTGKATRARLGYAVFDPKSGKLSKRRFLEGQVRLYNQQVVYLPQVKRFLLTCTGADGKGRACLIAPSGKVVARQARIGGFAREARPALVPHHGAVTLVCPRSAGGVQWLRASKSRIAVGKTCLRGTDMATGGRAAMRTRWSSRGTVGFPAGDRRHVYFATLGATRLEFVRFAL